MHRLSESSKMFLSYGSLQSTDIFSFEPHFCHFRVNTVGDNLCQRSIRNSQILRNYWISIAF